jgi:tetratricopeptide (TPR) repeat protein
MSNEAEGHDIATIRRQLLDAFSAETLPRFCQDRPTLRPILDHFGPKYNLHDMVDEVLGYCGRYDLFDPLLAALENYEPSQYGPAAPIIASPFNLPASLADFTGREADTMRVRQRLGQQGAVAISGIHGMGGIGKTALALQVAHGLAAAGRFRDAQLYLDLKGTDPLPLEPVTALQALLSALLGPDPRRPADVDTLSGLWRSAIDGRDAVLILDNAAGAAQVRPLLPGCPTCAVLVTSRRRFALPGAVRLDLDPMRPADARALLQRLAPRLGDDDADAIAGLCGHLPLALRVAGNYLALNDDTSPGRYAALLKGEQDRLARLRDPEDPDLDVEATITLSLAQLDAETRHSWALLALLPAPFDLVAAAALWGELREQESEAFPVLVLDEDLPTDLGQFLQQLVAAMEPEPAAEPLPEGRRQVLEQLVATVGSKPAGEPLPEEVTLSRLQELRNRSLVSYDVESGRYEQHDLVRLTAGRELSGLAENEISAARDRLTRHYLVVAEKARDAQRYPDLDPDWPHLRAAFADASARDGEAGRRLAVRVVRAVEDYLDLRGLWVERTGWLERGIVCARQLEDQVAEVDFLSRLGLAYADLGQIRKAIEYHQAALSIAQEIDDPRLKAPVLGSLGLAYADLGEVRRAIEYYEQALAIAQQLDDRRGEGGRLANLGTAYAALGEVRKAMEYHEQALAISKEIGDRRLEGATLNNLGLAHADLGQDRRAIEDYQQGLAIAREIGDRQGEGHRLANLGNAFAALGEILPDGGRPGAIKYYEQALAIAQEIGDRHLAGAALGNLGAVYDRLGEVQKAIGYYQQQLAIAREIGDRWGEGTDLANLGVAYKSLGDLTRARELWTQALAIREAIEDPRAETVRRWLAELNASHDSKSP